MADTSLSAKILEQFNKIGEPYKNTSTQTTKVTDDRDFLTKFMSSLSAVLPQLMQTIMLQKYMGGTGTTDFSNAGILDQTVTPTLQNYNTGLGGGSTASAGIPNSTLTSALQAVLGNRGGGAGATIPNTLGGATAGAGNAMANLGIDPSTGQSKQQQIDYIAMLLKNLFPAGFKR